MYNKHTFVVCLCKGGGGDILLFSCGLEFFCKCPISEVDFNKSIFGLLSFLPWERAKSAVKLLRRLLLALNSSKREPRSKDVKEPLWLNLIIRLNLSALNILSFSEASYSCSSWWSFSSSSSSSLFPEKKISRILFQYRTATVLMYGNQQQHTLWAIQFKETMNSKEYSV